MRFDRAFVTVSVTLAVGALAGAAPPAASDARVAAAARSRDIARVRTLITERADVNGRQADGATALHWAAYWGDSAIADQLMRAGASVDAANDLGVTPLYLASAGGHVGIAKALLAAGAKPGALTLSGESPLMAASRVGSAAIVIELVARGADVNVRERTRDQTALMWAAARRHPDVVRALLAGGADITARSRVRPSRTYLPADRNGSGNTPEEHARFSRSVPEGGYTALLFAVQQGDVESARALIDAGADVDDAAPDGTTALVLAAHDDHAPLVELLLDRGADPNAPGAGYTALHAGVLRGNLDTVKALIAHRANVAATIARATGARRYSADWALGDNLIGAPPAYLAAAFAEIRILDALFAAGSDPAFAMADGTTLIMAAMRTPATRSGEAEGFGTDRRDRYFFARLLTAQSKGEAESETLAVVKRVIAAGADVNAADSAGDTAMHRAVAQGLVSVIEALAEGGAKLDVKNRRGLTPLGVAQAPRSRRGGDAAAANPAIPALLKKLGATE
jgi:uncharacterized protein